MKTLLLNILGKILYQANRYANSLDDWQGDRQQFYGLKKRLLIRYAKNNGHAVQYFPKKECWGCGGSGIYEGWHSMEECYKCCGTGTYLPEKWVIHRRSVIGRYSFLTPLDSVFTKQEAERYQQEENRFKGFVQQHRSKSDLDCFLLMCGLFHPIETFRYINQWSSIIYESCSTPALKAFTWVLVAWKSEKLTIQEEFDITTLQLSGGTY